MGIINESSQSRTSLIKDMGAFINYQGASLPQPIKVFYAGGSHRRHLFLKSSFSDINVQQVDVEPEPLYPDVEGVAQHKILTALTRLSAQFIDGCVVFAADTRTETPKIDPKSGKTTIVSQGKPDNIDMLYETFAGLSATADDNHQPFYRVRSASSMLHLNGSATHYNVVNHVEITLNRSAVNQLTTHGGMNRYLQAFNEFYSSPPYSTHGLPVVTPGDLSAGLSLPVLVKLGIVESVYGVSSASQMFRMALTHAMHTVAVGVSTDLIAMFKPSVGDLMQKDNKWLHGVVASALGDYK